MNGLDVLLSAPTLPYAGARVGLLAHAASVDMQGVHAVQRLQSRKEWNLTKLFSPEHGFFGKGAAGEIIHSGIHPVFGLPIYSLYGEHRRPPAEWLADLDLMVVDLQDLGVRCYTYASTLYHVLHVCAETGVPVMVLDRPTPLEGIVDGPDLDPQLKSFVGMIDLPLVYGFSQGPLARHLQKTEPGLAKLHLTVVDATSGAHRLPWHPPSPAIVSRASALLYPMTVWCEAIPEVDVDRGGPLSFQIWSMPDLNARKLVETLTLSGVEVQTGTGPKGWPALLFSVTEPGEYQPVTNALRLLNALCNDLGADRLFSVPGARPEFFDQLMGSRIPRVNLTKREEVVPGAGVEPARQ